MEDEVKVYHIKKNTKTGEVLGEPVPMVADDVFIENWDLLIARSQFRWVPVDPQPGEDV